MSIARTLIPALLALFAGLVISCDEEKDPQPTPPAAPTELRHFSLSQTTVGLQWNDNSSNESGFRIEVRQGSADWEVVVEVARNITTYTVNDLTQGTEYHFRVFGYNGEGDSEPSNEHTVTTQSVDLPNPPGEVTATPLAPTVVQVTWRDRDTAHGFHVERRLPEGEWEEIITLPDNLIEHIDSTVVPETTYYYRVGAFNEAGTAWAEDSAAVTTPPINVPHAPTDLTVAADVGFGITLNWVDNALDEEGFHIRRNVSGELPEIIDSVEADVTEYFDSLGITVGIYSYSVRAYNIHGASSWTPFATADYRFCSDGVVPLCIGNFWDYEVDDGENPVYEIRRTMVDVAYPGGEDHYLEVEDRLPPTGQPDSVRYMRNFEEEGLFAVSHPLSEGSVSELLFDYPPSGVGSWYVFEGDCVIVTATGTSIFVGDTLYTGVVGYQRFLAGSERSIQYFVKPTTIGVILEEEFVNSIRDVSRAIIGYQILN